jgi:ribonuclease HI
MDSRWSEIQLGIRWLIIARSIAPSPHFLMDVYTDAACGDSVSGMGWVVVLESGDTIEGRRHVSGDHTSMESEYYALLDGIREAKAVDRDEIILHSDCKPLIVKMRAPDKKNDEWENRFYGCRRLLNKFDTWRIEWTPRGNNRHADELARQALDAGRDQ